MLGKLLLWALFNVPESTLMVLVGFRFLGITRPFRRVLLAGAVIAAFIVMVREVFPIGYHTVLALMFHCLVLVVYLGLSAKTAVIACFISSLPINVGQAVIIPFIVHVAGLTISEVLANVWLNIIYGWAGNVFLVAAYVFALVYKRPLIVVSESDRQWRSDRVGSEETW